MVSWENRRKTIGKIVVSWENHRKIIGKILVSWENRRKTIGKWWFDGNLIVILRWDITRNGVIKHGWLENPLSMHGGF